MIGNDVVDLSSSESRDIHPRFDQLALTPAERALLPGCAEPHRLRWQFWSAKEAAYKLLRRMYPHTSFVPRRFHVLPAPAGARALVHHGFHVVQVQWQAGEDFVHAVARMTGDASRAPGIIAGEWALEAESPATISRQVRELALDAIAGRTGLRREAISVRSRNRIPDLVTTAGDWLGFLSLSHHGRFGAYACFPGRPAG